MRLFKGKNIRLKESAGWLDKESLRNDNNKVKFYTGLPSFSALLTLFTYVSAHMKSGQQSILTHFQQFVMVLVKFWLNLANQDIVYRFGVHQSTVSRSIRNWIDVMYIRLKPTIKWPEREELLKTMPKGSKGFAYLMLID